MPALTYTFANFCILKMIVHRIVHYWLHIFYATSYHEARERSLWADHSPPHPQSDHVTFARNMYNHMMDQPPGLKKKYTRMGSRKPCITKHKTFSVKKILQNYILFILSTLPRLA
jgi:hypothetical protein